MRVMRRMDGNADGRRSQIAKNFRENTRPAPAADHRDGLGTTRQSLGDATRRPEKVRHGYFAARKSSADKMSTISPV